MSKGTVGVIGLGSMGLGVARTLLAKGFTVHACDVRPEVVSSFAAEGGLAAAGPGALGAAVPIAIVLVVNADQTEQVLFGPDGAALRMAPGSVIIASSTVAPDYATDLGRRLAERGLLMIDAPVSGGAARAAKGDMTGCVFVEQRVEKEQAAAVDG